MSALHRKKLERPASVRAAQILHRTEKTAHQRARLMYGAFALREMTSLVCALRRRLWQASLFKLISTPRHRPTAIGASLDTFKSRDFLVEFLMQPRVFAMAHRIEISNVLILIRPSFEQVHRITEAVCCRNHLRITERHQKSLVDE